MNARPDFATLQQAAEWFATLESGDDSARQQAGWQAWLDASEANRTAWQRVQSVQSRFAAVAPRPQDAGAASTALDAAARGRSRRNSLRLLGVAAASVLAGWAGLRQAASQADLSTATGETRDFTLPDGGRIWLSPDSAVALDYQADQRKLRLLSGEIVVETAHDRAVPPRPFLVVTGHGRLRALGTRFSVRRIEDGQTLLSVFEGAVEATPFTGAARVIAAGRQVGLSDAGLGAEADVDPAREAWRHGLLLADDMPLAALVAELGRYRRGHLACSADVAGLRVAGAFPLADSDRALAMLAQALPVRIETTTPWWVTVQAR